MARDTRESIRDHVGRRDPVSDSDRVLAERDIAEVMDSLRLENRLRAYGAAMDELERFLNGLHKQTEGTKR